MDWLGLRIGKLGFIVFALIDRLSWRYLVFVELYTI